MSGSLIASSYRRLERNVAERHRRAVAGVSFIAVTGSAGKTTTKDLIAAVLSSRHRGSKSPGTHNSAHWVTHTVLGARRGDGFCVHELGATGPGSLDDAIALVRPRIAVVTNVGGDHRSAFRTLDATATEKAKVVHAVPRAGFAVLNADDPRVLAMAGGCRGRVLTYGLHPDALVRAESVRSSWPDRLAFTLIHGEQRVAVQTRLCGLHWIHACLAAITTGIGLGVPLPVAAAALAAVEPLPGRYQPVEAAGVAFIRDEFKASLWSVAPAVEFLRDARAVRKVAVFGTISDYAGRASQVYADVARQALHVADEVIFVGPQAVRSGGARNHPKGWALRAFPSISEAHRYLSETLVPGDLVMLKGSQRADHLLRLVLARQGRIGVLEAWLPAGQVLRRVPAAARAGGRMDPRAGNGAGRDRGCVAPRPSRSACWCRRTPRAGPRSASRPTGCWRSRSSSGDRCAAGWWSRTAARSRCSRSVARRRPSHSAPGLFGELPSPEYGASCSLRDPAAAAGAAHLVVAEVHRWLAPRFRRAGWVVVPGHVRWAGDLAQLPPAGMSRSLKDDLRKVRSRGFALEQAGSEADWEEFTSRMLAPHASARFGDDAWIPSPYLLGASGKRGSSTSCSMAAGESQASARCAAARPSGFR